MDLTAWGGEGGVLKESNTTSIAGPKPNASWDGTLF